MFTLADGASTATALALYSRSRAEGMIQCATCPMPSSPLRSPLCPPQAARWRNLRKKPFSHTIRPRQIAEECFELPAGETIGYTFEATSQVDFNIHFHRGKDVEYPVKGEQVREAADRFTASVTEEFCLMWSNRTLQMVTVKGELPP